MDISKCIRWDFYETSGYFLFLLSIEVLGDAGYSYNIPYTDVLGTNRRL